MDECVLKGRVYVLRRRVCVCVCGEAVGIKYKHTC